jgi:hypothetical protein
VYLQVIAKRPPVMGVTNPAATRDELARFPSSIITTVSPWRIACQTIAQPASPPPTTARSTGLATEFKLDFIDLEVFLSCLCLGHSETSTIISEDDLPTI